MSNQKATFPLQTQIISPHPTDNLSQLPRPPRPPSLVKLTKRGFICSKLFSIFPLFNYLIALLSVYSQQVLFFFFFSDGQINLFSRHLNLQIYKKKKKMNFQNETM